MKPGEGPTIAEMTCSTCAWGFIQLQVPCPCKPKEPHMIYGCQLESCECITTTSNNLLILSGASVDLGVKLRKPSRWMDPAARKHLGKNEQPGSPVDNDTFISRLRPLLSREPLF